MNYKLEGSGKTLLFIHGLSDSLLYWEFLAAGLRDDYQVLRADLRGHGESELGSCEISIGTYAKDLNGLLEELDISKVSLIGFSLGGAVALDFALRYPEKVDRLVLMSSFYKVDDDLRSVLHQFINTLNVGFEEFYDYILPKVLCPDVICKNRDELEAMKIAALPDADADAYLRAAYACLGFDVEMRLSEIDVPALILASKYDEISTLDMQTGLCEKITDSRMVVFDDVKHNLLVGKNNEKILEELKGFLGDG